MIYSRPADEEAIDQGDLIEGYPLSWPVTWDLDQTPPLTFEVELQRVIVLTQTCDLANQKATRIVVTPAPDARAVVESGVLKASDVKGPVRAGRVWGWYFLPKSDE